MYSVNSNKKLDKRISSDMKIIVSKILTQFISVKSIFLVGGFGRGEGSVIEYQGEFQPINDYDLVVIGDCWVKNADKELFRKELALLTKIRQVDIVLLNPNKLKKLKFTMFNFDLKYSSKLLYGSNSSLDKIPSWDPNKMPTIEAVRPLFLFLSSILQAYPGKNVLKTEDIFWSYQQLTKSILGWSTAMLIFKGKYNPSYKKRNEIFQEIFFEEFDLCKMVDEATQFKLSPKIQICSYEELVVFWSKVNTAHLKVLKILITRYYKIKNNNWSNVSFRYQYSLNNIAKVTYSFLSNNPHYRNCLNTDLSKLYFCIWLKDRKNKDIESSKFFYEKLRIKNKASTLHLSDKEFLDFLLKADINAQIFYSNENKVFL